MLSCTGKDPSKPDLTIDNFLLIMVSDKKYKDVRYNELRGVAEVHTGKEIRTWSDADEAESMKYIEAEYKMYSKERHTAALRLLFMERSYNPLMDIIEKAKWDGEPRCQKFLTKWLRCEDTPYVHEVSRLIFAGGIHRLYHPGCKFENVPIFIGDQGCGKSTITMYLALKDDYHGNLKVMEGQQAIEDLQGHWIMEIPEMSAFTKAKDQDAIKAYISRQRDQYRRPYDRNVTEIPRRCIFLANSNTHTPLIDKTGNRRWFPVECGGDASWGYYIFDHEAEIKAYILQCWAEAKEKIDTPEMKPYLNEGLIKLANEAQENALQDDWRVGAIESFLERKNAGEITCVREVSHRALSPNPDIPKDPTLVEAKDIGQILDRMKGWKRCKSARMCGIYGKQRCWEKIGDAEKPQAKPTPPPESTPTAAADRPFWEEENE